MVQKDIAWKKSVQKGNLQEDGRKLFWIRGIFLAITLSWMIVIFSFSAQPADDSGKTSQGVGAFLAELFVPGYEDWSTQRQEAFVEKIDHPVRKAGHLTEYAVLGTLVTGTVLSFGLRGKRAALTAEGIGVLYAASDEFHQLFVPGRGSQVTDVLIDASGFAVGVAAAFVIFWMICRYRRKKEQIAGLRETERTVR